MIPKKTGVHQNPGRYGFKLFYTHLKKSLDMDFNFFWGGSAGKKGTKKANPTEVESAVSLYTNTVYYSLYVLILSFIKSLGKRLFCCNKVSNFNTVRSPESMSFWTALD